MTITERDRVQLEQVLRSVESSLTVTAAQIIHDTPVREAYIRQVKAGIADIRTRFAQGRIMNVELAAREAHQFRNYTLQALRARTSPLGQAIARSLKEQGPDFNTIVARNTQKLFGASARFDRLTEAQRGQVYARIVERAGIANADVSQMLQRLRPVARGAFVIGLSYSVYTIATSDDPGRAAVREGASLGASILGGVAGGAAGGATAGLVCGPGAPVCVAGFGFVGAIIGGGLAAFGVEIAMGR